MAIQVVPVIKVLSSVITTAGDMFAVWQTVRNQTRDRPPHATGTNADDVGAKVEALQESSARNSYLIAQVAEQVQKLAVDLQLQGNRIDRRLKVAKVLSFAAGGLSLAALGVAFYAVHSVA